MSDQDVLNREAGARVTAYAQSVVAGATVVGEFVRLACERHLRDLEEGPARGLRFDEVEAGWTIRFFPAVLRHYKGEWGPRGNQPGKPVELLPWEEFVVGSIFGWLRRNPDPDHEIAWVRRFTRAYVEVGKKNGKDLLAAGCGIRLAFFDGEPGAEVYCLDPATRVLTNDLRWVPVGSINVGDVLLGFDEHVPSYNTFRKYRHATVTSSEVVTQERYEIVMEDGRTIVASAAHMWLGMQAPFGERKAWIRTDRLQPGSRIRNLGMPWETATDWAGGYLAGVYDGEGSLYGRKGRIGARVAFGQRPGQVMDLTRQLLQEKGIHISPIRQHASGVETFDIGGTYEALRFLGEIRPRRLLERAVTTDWLDGRTPGRGGHAVVKSIRPIGSGPVVAIGTTTGTLIAEGLFSHNCVATKKDQARLTWSDMDTLVAKSPALRSRIKRSARALYDEGTKSKVMPLSSEEGGEEGINPHGGLVNELHRHASDRMLSMVENSFGSRLQPLLLIYTTAGEPGGQTVWASERRMAERMLRGIDDNDQYFAAVYAIDEDDDPFDEACWPKANPSMPITPKLEEMRQRAAEAKAEPSKLNAFLRLRLNRPASSVSRFFDVTAWHDERNGEPPAAADNQDAWGGIDLGWSRDLSAFALWVPRPDGRFDVRLRCWAPEAAARARGDGLYERFADLGLLTLTEGDVRDDDVVEADILDEIRDLRIRRLMYDRALASGLVTRLQRALGDDVVEPVGQGWVSLSPAMKELDRLAVARKLAHGGNQLLLWMVANTDAKTDDNGNVRPAKPNRNSPDKIDGVSALVDAVAGWLGDTGGDDEPTESAYDGLDADQILERMRL